MANISRTGASSLGLGLSLLSAYGEDDGESENETDLPSNNSCSSEQVANLYLSDSSSSPGNSDNPSADEKGGISKSSDFGENSELLKCELLLGNNNLLEVNVENTEPLAVSSKKSEFQNVCQDSSISAFMQAKDNSLQANASDARTNAGIRIEENSAVSISELEFSESCLNRVSDRESRCSSSKASADEEMYFVGGSNESSAAIQTTEHSPQVQTCNEIVNVDIQMPGSLEVAISEVDSLRSSEGVPEYESEPSSTNVSPSENMHITDCLSPSSPTPMFFTDKTCRKNPYIEEFSSGSEIDSESSSESSLETSEESSSSSEEDAEPVKMHKKAPLPSTHKTKGELSIEDLPLLEDLHISVPEADIHLIGYVRSIVGTQVIVESLANERPLDLESVLFLSNGKAFGKIFDVFGQVVHPMYSVRFNSKEDIDSVEVKIGDPIYSAPKHKDVTIFIFTEGLKKERGTDASWEHNNEPPVEFLDFSDDEEERAHRQKLRAKHKNGDRVDKNENSGTPIRKPKIQENRLPRRHFLRPQQFQVRPGNDTSHHWNHQQSRHPVPIRPEQPQVLEPTNNFQFTRFPPPPPPPPPPPLLAPPPPPPPPPLLPPPFVPNSGVHSNIFQANANVPQFSGPPPFLGLSHEILNGSSQPRPDLFFPAGQNGVLESHNLPPNQFQNYQQYNGPNHWGEPRPNHLPPITSGQSQGPPQMFQFRGPPPSFFPQSGPFPSSFLPFQANQRLPQFGGPPPYFGPSPQQFNGN